MQLLPYSGFSWVGNPNDGQVFWNLPEDSPFGFFLEVDLDYPVELDDKHNDLPLFPEPRSVQGSKHTKLMTKLYCKERYVLHYRVL